MDVEQVEQVAVEAVYNCITGTFSPDASVRTPAEIRLKAWEEDASPGFLLALVKILEGCPDEVGHWACIAFLQRPLTLMKHLSGTEP